jgi:hypothetical protein
MDISTPNQEISMPDPANEMDDVGKRLRERSMAEYNERMKGKPTPTQAEIDAALRGEHTMEHEEDGSNPDPAGGPPEDGEKIRERSAAEFAERSKGKPTPTQDELNKILKGERPKLEEDGSGPDTVTGRPEADLKARHVEAAPSSKPQTYQTRQMRSAPPPAPPKAE